MKLTKRVTLAVVVISIALVFDSAEALGCPTCKDSLLANQTALAFAISILFMMSMPFFILGSWLAYFFRISRFREE